MRKRHLTLVFVLGVLCCVFSPGASAQAPDNCFATNTWGFPLAIPTGWAYYGGYPGTLTYVIWAWKGGCPSPGAGDEVCLSCQLAAAGKPINLTTGNTYIQENDVRIPGLSGGLSLVRSWNSKWPATQSALQVGLFGPNWRSTYEEQVFVGSDSYIKYARGDGSFWSFGTTGSVQSWSLASPQNIVVSLIAPSTSAPYWVMAFQNGEQRRFDETSGMLTSIIDRNGNSTTLTYDGASRLVTVTDPVSRHLYFTYGSSSSHLVTGVSSDVGISLSYSYDSQNRLSQVTNPDLSTLTFAYDSQSRITSVTDSNGKVLESHTYDSSSRGLTSSRALGVEALSITYP
jgi:YD repeat-containing protein